MKHIWIIGKGMLGKHFEYIFQQNKIDFLITDKEVDITKLENLQNFIQDKDISWIINCAAYTNVDLAEKEQKLAYGINANGVENIALIAKQLDIPLIHFSTDYVFSGDKQEPYNENDIPNPQNMYGKSKLEGEQKIQSILTKYFIFRLSWLYGYFGNNFVFKMLQQFSEKKHIKVVKDQYGSPTFTGEVVNLILHIINNNLLNYGVYHMSGRGKTSWYEYCLTIHNFFKPKKLLLFRPVQSDYFPTIAKRPKNSYLDCSKFEKTFNIQINEWSDILFEFIKVIKNENV